MADWVAIVNELVEVDWFSRFSRKNWWIVAWACSTRWYGAALKDMYPWITGELIWLKNKKTKAYKKRCLEDETIDDCECKQLRREFFSLREEYQLMDGRAYDDYRVGIKEAIKSDPKTFFGYVDLRKKLIGYPSVIHFEGRLASGPEDICNLFADFIQQTYAEDVWVPSDPGPDFVLDVPPFGALQFTVDEVQSVLLEL
jgi:hypothetical protein